jgi:hypothetical protein
MSPRVPRVPPDTLRFFARIDRFTCECPRCGQIIQAHFDRAIGQIRREQAENKRPARGLRMTYNPLSSRLTCPQCRRTFGVGLLLYPVHPRATGRQPVDTRPTYQQLMDIRQQAGGFFVHQPKRGADPVNLAVEAECSCPPRGRRSDCPIHGWEQGADPSIVSPIGGEEEDQ